MLTKIDSSRLLSVSRGKLWARWRRIANLIHANSDNEVANLLLHARWTSQDGRLVGFSCPFGPLGREVLTFCLIFMLIISGSCPLWTSCIFLFVFFFSVSLLHSFMASFFFFLFLSFSSLFFSFISLPSFFSFPLPFFFSSYLFLSLLCCPPFRLSCLPSPSFYRLSLSPLFLPFLSCLSFLSITPLLFLPSIRPLFLLLFYHIFTFLLLKLGVV